jgi:hypothetical protein
MGILDTVKDVAILIQKADNIELVKQVMALQIQAQDLVEENRLLKAKLATREALTFRKNAYWLSDDGPFCSKCWDADAKLVRLHVRVKHVPTCPNCGRGAVDPDTPLRPRGRSSTWLMPR